MIIENQNKIVHRIYMNNSLQNYSYLIGCTETKEALLVDPYDSGLCLRVIKEGNWNLKTIVNTHDHWDHIGGNSGVIKATGAKLMAHQQSIGTIADVDHGLKEGDTIELGSSLHLKVMHTPGHTEQHICLLSIDNDPILVCGDTLFNAGCGNVSGGGNINHLYETFKNTISQLPATTKVLPGHDYIENNLNFTLSRESDNSVAKELLQECKAQTPDSRVITTLETEKKTNVFFRLDSMKIFEQLQLDFPNLSNNPRQIFTHLRKMRDRW